MSEGCVSFKGTANGLSIIMKEEADFESILNQITKKIESAGNFFSGVSLAVKYRGKKLTEQEEAKIVQLLNAKSGAEVISLEQEVEESAKIQSTTKQLGSKLKMRNYFFNGIQEGTTKFYRGTVRSGQLIRFEGNLVVIGDVNPGGELIATGNVVVMGTLRGIVHAGSDGNKEAIIVSNNLQATQLRIADVITRSPDGKETKHNATPELAYVKEDKIYIESFLVQRS